MRTVFHVTEAGNWGAIQEEGLIPQVGERSAELNEPPGIYVFPTEDDMNTALSQWLGEWFDEKEEQIDAHINLISLKILLPDSIPIEHTQAPYELRVTEAIPPMYIELHKHQ